MYNFKSMYYKIKEYLFPGSITTLYSLQTTYDLDNERIIIIEKSDGIKETTYIYDDGRIIKEGKLKCSKS